MSKFTASKKVVRIEWDFTGVPHVDHGTDPDAPEFVQGKHVVGVLPEPNPEQVAAFLHGYADIVAEGANLLRRADVAFADAEAAGEDLTGAALNPEAFYLAQVSRSIDALAAIGVPRDLLEQLPPRVIREFLHHVSEDLQGEGDAA